MEDVEVSLKGILANYVRSDVVQVYLQTSRPEEQALSAVRRAWERLDHPVLFESPGGVAAWSKGPVITMHGVETVELATELLTGLGREIAAEGCGGRLRPIPRQSTPLANPDAALSGITAGLCVKGHSNHRQPTRWLPAPGAMAAIIDAALAWTDITDTGGVHYVRSGLSGFRCTPEQRRGLLMTGLNTEWGTDLVWTSGPDEIRSVTFGYGGTVYFGMMDPENRWESALEDLVGVTGSLVEHLQYAAIRRGRLGNAMWGEFLDHTWPPREDLKYGFDNSMRYLAETHVPDVFGAQLLGPNHGVPQLSGKAWQLRPLSGGSAIILHEDPAAWFKGSKPEPGTLAQARNDFASLLISDAAKARAHKLAFAEAGPPQLVLPSE
jgi:hypothetical protein